MEEEKRKEKDKDGVQKSERSYRKRDREDDEVEERRRSKRLKGDDSNGGREDRDRERESDEDKERRTSGRNDDRERRRDWDRERSSKEIDGGEGVREREKGRSRDQDGERDKEREKRRSRDRNGERENRDRDKEKERERSCRSSSRSRHEENEQESSRGWDIDFEGRYSSRNRDLEDEEVEEERTSKGSRGDDSNWERKDRYGERDKGRAKRRSRKRDKEKEREVEETERSWRRSSRSRRHEEHEQESSQGWDVESEGRYGSRKRDLEDEEVEEQRTSKGSRGDDSNWERNDRYGERDKGRAERRSRKRDKKKERGVEETERSWRSCSRSRRHEEHEQESSRGWDVESEGRYGSRKGSRGDDSNWERKDRYGERDKGRAERRSRNRDKEKERGIGEAERSWRSSSRSKRHEEHEQESSRGWDVESENRYGSRKRDLEDEVVERRTSKRSRGDDSNWERKDRYGERDKGRAKRRSRKRDKEKEREVEERDWDKEKDREVEERERSRRSSSSLRRHDKLERESSRGRDIDFEGRVGSRLKYKKDAEAEAYPGRDQKTVFANQMMAQQSVTISVTIPVTSFYGTNTMRFHEGIYLGASATYISLDSMAAVGLTVTVLRETAIGGIGLYHFEDFETLGPTVVVGAGIVPFQLYIQQSLCRQHRGRADYSSLANYSYQYTGPRKIRGLREAVTNLLRRVAIEIRSGHKMQRYHYHLVVDSVIEGIVVSPTGKVGLINHRSNDKVDLPNGILKDLMDLDLIAEYMEKIVPGLGDSEEWIDFHRTWKFITDALRECLDSAEETYEEKLSGAMSASWALLNYPLFLVPAEKAQVVVAYNEISYKENLDDVPPHDTLALNATPNIAGWFDVAGTVTEYDVGKAFDEDPWLRRKFDESLTPYGTPFDAFQCSRNILKHAGPKNTEAYVVEKFMKVFPDWFGQLHHAMCLSFRSQFYCTINGGRRSLNLIPALLQTYPRIFIA